MHSPGGATINIAAYSVNFRFKFNSPEVATIYDDGYLINYDIQMLFTYVLLHEKCHFVWLKLHWPGGATVNNAAYSVNFRFKFYCLDGATIYDDG